MFSDIEHLFMCVLAIYLYVVFGEMHVGLLPIFWLFFFFFFLLSCMSCLYILEIKPLSVASFADVFSQSTGYLFVVFVVSFAV